MRFGWCQPIPAHAFARLTIMQSDPRCVHVLMLTLIYAPDGLYPPPFCSACRFLFSTDIIFFSPPSTPYDPRFLLGTACGTNRTDLVGFLDPLHGAFKNPLMWTDLTSPGYGTGPATSESSLTYRRTPPGQRLSAQPRQRGVPCSFLTFPRALHDV